jgi:uncharacterized protein HemY
MHLYKGYLHNLKKEWEWAKEQFKQSLDILREIDVPLKLCHWIFEVSQVYIENGEPLEARELLNEALDLATRCDNENLRREIEVALNRLMDAERSSIASGFTQTS